MKKILFALALSLLAASAAAQTVMIGDRAPELRTITWLGGQQPRPAQLTYIEFFQSSNPACKNSVERLQTLSKKLGDKFHVVVISSEKEDKVGILLTTYVSEHVSVGVDSSDKVFPAFGITYVPSGVLVDAKNRVLWMGNSLQMTEQLIDKITR